MVVHVVYGLKMEGTRDILAIELSQEAPKASYNHIYASLKARGLEKVWLVISEALKGLVASIRESFAAKLKTYGATG